MYVLFYFAIVIYFIAVEVVSAFYQYNITLCNSVCPLTSFHFITLFLPVKASGDKQAGKTKMLKDPIFATIVDKVDLLFFAAFVQHTAIYDIYRQFRK